MIELIISLVKTLAPFLKESILQGSTPKQWIAQNKVTCLWLSFQLVMLLTVMYLATTVFRQATLLHTATHETATLTAANTKLNEELLKVSAEHALLKETHGRLDLEHQGLLAEGARLEERVEQYEAWMANCGIDYRYTGTGYPSCPVKRVVVKRTVMGPAPTPAPTPIPAVPVVEDKKPTFRDRLRAIFTPAKKEGE